MNVSNTSITIGYSMDIRKLRMFHEVYVTGSVTKAAERVCVSQAAASKTLSGFEQEIGYKLFSRKGGRLSPTDEAYYLYEEVVELLQSINRLETSIKEAKSYRPGRLRIGSTIGPSYSFLPKIIAEFMTKNPDVKASLHQLGCTAIREGVGTGHYQIGLVDRAGPSPRYDSSSVDLPCYCAVPSTYPAAKLSLLSPSDLDGVPWATLSTENETYKSLKKAYAKRKSRFNPVVEVHSTPNALQFVALGTGVALIDSLSKSFFLDISLFQNIKIIPFEPKIFEPIEIITSNLKPISGIAEQFHTALVTQLETLAR